MFWIKLTQIGNSTRSKDSFVGREYHIVHTQPLRYSSMRIQYHTASESSHKDHLNRSTLHSHKEYLSYMFPQARLLD